MLNNMFRGRHSQYSSYKSNATTPLTVFTSSIGTGCIYSITHSEDLWVKIFSAVLISLILILFGFVYLYLLFKDPEKLQSEGARLEEKALDYLAPNSSKEANITIESGAEQLLNTPETPTITN